MGLGLAEWLIVLVVGALFVLGLAVPIAVLLWMAAQYLHSRQLGERVTSIESELARWRTHPAPIEPTPLEPLPAEPEPAESDSDGFDE